MTPTLLLFLVLYSPARLDTALQRIQALIAVEALQGTIADLAGVYVNPAKELSRAPDPNVGRTALYLFTDGTYLYLEQSSLFPLTIFDKGTWNSDGEDIQLKSSSEIAWNPDLERRFLCVHRTSHSDEALLIGEQMAVKRFEALAKGDPDTALLTISKQRRRRIPSDQVSRIKASLLKRAWRPERLGAAPPTIF